ncbi:hypothetical protein [Cryptosporangium arvum]|uniref:SWIM-type domain-containing protein n=1 Tax=Cryptosporangium arvum DSM 44712 TaxID=927661 RepID=A0A010YZS2_9ACTN|nr:hypothetical protein [Cryptosporangium arvum]EXG80703.1 hypothetical protein CryarDRAFT_1790 [Cryptosporangium arvum DSM 44712]
MSVVLPPVDGVVLADAVDALPGRLRKRLDGAVAKVAGYAISVDGPEWTVRIDDATVVTLRTVDGAVRASDDARCSCLLAPACLHRAATLAAAPATDDDDESRPESPAPNEPSAGPDATTTGSPTLHADDTSPDPARTGAVGPTRSDASAPAPPGTHARSLTEAQTMAVYGVWEAAGAVLAAGTTGSGAVLRAALLRAAHEARAHGLHHLAAGARQVAAHLHDARTAAPHYRLATLADDLRELLLLAHRLRDPATPAGELPALLGTARREYTPRGSLRLHGLCTVPVLARSGHAGTATYAADRDGTLWLVADIYPGGAERAATTVDAAIPVGEGVLSHRELARTGLMVTGATASASRQLGAGRDVRAVRAGGAPWTESPLAPLWDVPVESQLDRAFAALPLPVQDRPTGDDLLFLRVEPVAPGDGGVVAVTADGRLVTLVAALDHPALAYRDNLRVLGTAAGVPLLVIGRPDPTRPGHVQLLALAPDRTGDQPSDPTGDQPSDPTGGDQPPDPTEDQPPALRLPPEWAGHADLGYDRLHSSMITGDRSAPGIEPTERSPARHDHALELLRRHLDRAVDGGRAVHAFARPDQRLLRRARWDTGADLLAALEAAARPGRRDVFGRLADDDGRRFVLAWLAAAVYEQTAAWALSRAAWSPEEERLSP